MIRLLRHRIVRLLRLPVLATLVLAVLVNPVFAAVGDLHESSHRSMQMAPLAGSHDDAHDAHDAGALDEEVDLLHALMHAAHCCGHLTAILSTPFVAYAPLFSDAVPVPAFAAPHSPPRTDHFRPPIAV